MFCYKGTLATQVRFAAKEKKCEVEMSPWTYKTKAERRGGGAEENKVDVGVFVDNHVCKNLDNVLETVCEKQI